MQKHVQNATQSVFYEPIQSTDCLVPVRKQVNMKYSGNSFETCEANLTGLVGLKRKRTLISHITNFKYQCIWYLSKICIKNLTVRTCYFTHNFL